jgi:hypothetical protein
MFNPGGNMLEVVTQYRPYFGTSSAIGSYLVQEIQNYDYIQCRQKDYNIDIMNLVQLQSNSMYRFGTELWSVTH